MLDYLYNYFNTSNNNEKSYYYGWKHGNKWEKCILKKQLYNIYYKELVYYGNYSNIKYIDLRNRCPPVYDQGKLGSCTANALAFGYEYTELVQKNNNAFMPSRLFIYYNERDIEHSINIDSGAELYDGIFSLFTIGVCPEKEWNYDISKFTIKPDKKCYDDAKNNIINQFYALQQNLEQFKSALILGFPIIFGFKVYNSFESEDVAKTGIMTMPSKDDYIVGGHAVAAVGFDDSKKHFIVRNSWGDSWGDKGYFYMPYEYILNKDLSSDFWYIEQVLQN
jgi:C1A family cysteine protease